MQIRGNRRQVSIIGYVFTSWLKLRDFYFCFDLIKGNRKGVGSRVGIKIEKFNFIIFNSCILWKLRVEIVR